MRFSRYSTAQGPEAQTEPGSHGRVLRNLLGIRGRREIDQKEFDALLRAQEAYTHRITPDTRFTAALLRQMHRDWLGEIYEWAGRYRTVEVSKGAFRWPPAHLINDHMATLEAGLLADLTPCRPGTVDEIARRMAVIHGELLLIHPFRDGNGRLARWLADLMALQGGLSVPEYRFTGRGSRSERLRYLSSVQHAYLEEYAPLADFFREALERRLG